MYVCVFVMDVYMLRVNYIFVKVAYHTSIDVTNFNHLRGTT
jgi:hypothetical protein